VSKQINTDVKVKRFKLSELEMAAYNPRMIGEDAKRGLVESLERFGMLEAPVVNVHGGKKRVVGGHQRIRALIERGFTHADCVVVRFDDAAEMAANLALNNTATQGVYDPAKIANGLDSLRKLLPKPDFMRFDAAAQRIRAQAARMRAETGPKAGDDETPTIEEEVASKVGEVYQLGDHRLYCGDFVEGVARLLPDHYAHVVITDPPYNIGYTSGKHFRKDKLREPIEGDAQDADEWQAFVERLAATLLDSASAAIYVFWAARELPTLQAAWLKHKGVVHRWLVMAKDAHPLSPGDYHPQYELCLLGSRRDAELRRPTVARSNVLPVARPAKNSLHPTQKPVDLIRQLIEDSTDVEEVVLDPFAGSGTTLVVAQELARVCYACELEPAYVDVIRRRWAEQVHGADCDWKKVTPSL